MEIQDFLNEVKNRPVKFEEVMQFIDEHYTATPTSFDNGSKHNDSSENQGSAKLLYFAKVNHLTAEDALHLFGEHYQSVLNHPQGVDHQNIRQFQQNGWEGLKFDDVVLSLK